MGRKKKKVDTGHPSQSLSLSMCNREMDRENRERSEGEMERDR